MKSHHLPSSFPFLTGNTSICEKPLLKPAKGLFRGGVVRIVWRGLLKEHFFSTPKTTGFMGALTCAAVHHCVRLCIAGCFLFACSLFTGKKSKVTEAQWSVCKCDSHLPLWHSGWKPCIQIVTTYFKITDVILLNERCNKKPSIGRSPFAKWLCVFRSVTALQQSWETMQRYW